MDGLEDRLNRSIKEITNMKLNQTIGADSWIIYRHKYTINKIPGATYQIDFVPLIEGDFVARAYLSTNLFISGDNMLYPDPNTNGRWVLGKSDTATTVSVYVHSTKQGTIGISQM